MKLVFSSEVSTVFRIVFPQQSHKAASPLLVKEQNCKFYQKLLICHNKYNQKITDNQNEGNFVFSSCFTNSCNTCQFIFLPSGFVIRHIGKIPYHNLF